MRFFYFSTVRTRQTRTNDFLPKIINSLTKSSWQLPALFLPDYLRMTNGREGEQTKRRFKTLNYLWKQTDNRQSKNNAHVQWSIGGFLTPGQVILHNVIYIQTMLVAHDKGDWCFHCCSPVVLIFVLYVFYIRSRRTKREQFFHSYFFMLFIMKVY